MRTMSIAVALLALAGCGESEKPDKSDAPHIHNAGETHSEAPAATHKAHQQPAEAGVPQTICPVMGNAINKNLYVDHDGKRIYVCCGACVAEVKRNPQKYIDKLEAEGVALEQVPAGQ